MKNTTRKVVQLYLSNWRRAADSAAFFVMEIVISIIGVTISCATFFIGRMSANHADGMFRGESKTELKYIKKQIDKIVSTLDIHTKCDTMSIRALSLSIQAINNLNAHLRQEHGISHLHDLNFNEEMEILK